MTNTSKIPSSALWHWNNADKLFYRLTDISGIISALSSGIFTSADTSNSSVALGLFTSLSMPFIGSQCLPTSDYDTQVYKKRYTAYTLMRNFCINTTSIIIGASVESKLLELYPAFQPLFWTAVPITLGGALFADRIARKIVKNLEQKVNQNNPDELQP